MARLKTVVEILKEVYDDEGNLLDVDNNPMGDKKIMDQKQQYVEEHYHLLHWGLDATLVYDKENNPVPVTRTVAICEHIKTGQIEIFLPTRLKVLGVKDGV